MTCFCGKRILSCFSFLLLSAVSVCCQQAGSIVGELHVARGDFPGRVLIELQLHGSPITSQYTDEQGKFAFASVPNNPYHLIIRDERFYPVDEQAVLDVSISAIKMVQINLIPREKGQEPQLQPQKGTNPYLVDPEEYRRHFPKDAVKEFDRGVEADAKGKRDDAIRHYEKAITLAADFYPAHNNLGSEYLAKSDFKSAQSQFEEAIRLNQSDAQAHLNLANLFLTTKQYPQALTSVEEGLKREPNSPLGQFLLGSICARMGRFRDAERALHQALNLDPKMSRVHLELVNLYLSQQKNPEATAELKLFLNDSPHDPLAPKARELLNKLEPSP
jgi:tetratricopeptide (TPR) repeat protein